VLVALVVLVGPVVLAALAVLQQNTKSTLDAPKVQHLMDSARAPRKVQLSISTKYNLVLIPGTI
jgi:CHASE3 domain sensor protein